MMGGGAGALCLSWGRRGCTSRFVPTPPRDRHQAPTPPHHSPLSLRKAPAGHSSYTPPQPLRLRFRETGLLFAAQGFEGVGFTLPVIGVVGAQVNGLVGGLQRFGIARKTIEDPRLVVAGGSRE